MSIVYNADHFDTAAVIDFVLRERETSLSAREWKHRLAGYGFAVKETLEGLLVETLPQGEPICVLPEQQTA